MIQKPPQLRRLGLLSIRETIMIVALAMVLYFSGLWNPRGTAWKSTRGLWFKYFGDDDLVQSGAPVYWYIDDRGVKHFVTSLGKVPPQYRLAVRDENSLPVITRKDFVLPPKKVEVLSKKSLEKSAKKLGDSISNNETAKEGLEAMQEGLENFNNFVER